LFAFIIRIRKLLLYRLRRSLWISLVMCGIEPEDVHTDSAHKSKSWTNRLLTKMRFLVPCNGCGENVSIVDTSPQWDT
jgi:hypothetical protein